MFNGSAQVRAEGVRPRAGVARRQLERVHLERPDRVLRGLQLRARCEQVHRPRERPDARPCAITPERSRSEREVVKEERRLRDRQRHRRACSTRSSARWLFLAHPYRWPVIGWMARHRGASAARTASRYFRTYYAPNNATLFVVRRLRPRRRRWRSSRSTTATSRPAPRRRRCPRRAAAEGRAARAVPLSRAGAAVLIGCRARTARTRTRRCSTAAGRARSGEGARLNERLVYQHELAVNAMSTSAGGSIPRCSRSP